MTRAQGPGTEIAFRVTGFPTAGRVVVVLRSGPVATSDPDPEVTVHWDVRLVLIGLDGEELNDPPAFAGETPAGSTAQEVLSLLAEEAGESAVGLVAERAAASFAVSLAADLGARIDRLALVVPDEPDGPLAKDLLTEKLARVSAQALVIDVPDNAFIAQGYARRMPTAAPVLVVPDRPGASRLALSDVWPRVLAHVAPGVGHR